MSIVVKFLNFEIRSGVTYYWISIVDSSSKKTWTRRTRYSELKQIHTDLSYNNFDLPVFPPKRCCGNLEPEFINYRKKALENYLNTVLRSVPMNKLSPLLDFLTESKDMMSPQEKYEKNYLVAEKKPSRETLKSLKSSISKAYFENMVSDIQNKYLDISVALQPPEDFEKNFETKFKKTPSKIFTNILPKSNFLKKEIMKDSFVISNRSMLEAIEENVKALEKRKFNLQKVGFVQEINVK